MIQTDAGDEPIAGKPCGFGIAGQTYGVTRMPYYRKSWFLYEDRTDTPAGDWKVVAFFKTEADAIRFRDWFASVPDVLAKALTDGN